VDFLLGDTLIQDFVVSDPATGEAIDADAAPTIEVYAGSDTSLMATAVATKRDGATTGQYTFDVALTVGAGFVIGETYNVYAIAVVGGDIGKSVVSTFRIRVATVYSN